MGLSDKGEMLRHLKKFRTRTDGLSISIGEWSGVGRDNASDFSTMRLWDWRSAIGSTAESSNVEAAELGSCGCWEYLDGKEVLRGPFSNWQMREWWARSMFPRTLRIRGYYTSSSRQGKSERDAAGGPEFLRVDEVFAHAPEPFAAGWSPRAAQEPEGEQHDCAECGRKRWEGWSARGNWYCVSCWKRWETK